MNISCGIIRYEIHQQSVALLMDSSYFLSYKRFFNANHPTFCPGNPVFLLLFTCHACSMFCKTLFLSLSWCVVKLLLEGDFIFFFTFCEKILVKHLVVWNICYTFATQFGSESNFRTFSSAGLEHLPYKQRVGGSNPSTSTKLLFSGRLAQLV